MPMGSAAGRRLKYAWDCGRKKGEKMLKESPHQSQEGINALLRQMKDKMNWAERNVADAILHAEQGNIFAAMDSFNKAEDYMSRGLMLRGTIQVLEQDE